MARKKSSKSNGVTATLSNAADSVKDTASNVGSANGCSARWMRSRR